MCCLMCAGAWNDGYDGSADVVAERPVVELGSSMKLVGHNIVSCFSLVGGGYAHESVN